MHSSLEEQGRGASGRATGTVVLLATAKEAERGERRAGVVGHSAFIMVTLSDSKAKRCKERVWRESGHVVMQGEV